MNVLDVLMRLGYDTLSFKDGVYEVQLSKARQEIQGFTIERNMGSDEIF